MCAYLAFDVFTFGVGEEAMQAEDPRLQGNLLDASVPNLLRKVMRVSQCAQTHA